MADSEQFEKWRAALRSRFPLLAGWLRSRALRGLSLNRNDPRAVHVLIEALDHSDPTTVAAADAALRDLSDPCAVGAFCAGWEKSRDDRLAAILVENQYIPERPNEIRILSALKCGKAIEITSPKGIPCFVALLADTDETVRDGVVRCLERVTPGAAQDALCELAIRDPKGAAAKVCIRTGKRHRDPEQDCLFLFVTGQLDLYEQEDHEFQNLRLAMQRADATVRGHIMAVYRSGDRRVRGLIQAERKTLAQMSDAERTLFLQSCVKHQDWGRLFQACLELPLRYSLPMWEKLRNSGWQPEAPDLQAVYRQILAEAPGQAPSPRPPSATSSVFERWLSHGQKPEFAKLTETELLKQIESSDPPTSVSLVAALANKPNVSDGARRALANSPNWLVRLAGHATGVLGGDITQDEVQDSNYWVRELASADTVLDFWPEPTPAYLERLAQAPAEAWVGRLGGARKVLRTILARQTTVPDMRPMVVEAGEFTGEFVPATGAEFVADDEFPE